MLVKRRWLCQGPDRWVLCAKALPCDGYGALDKGHKWDNKKIRLKTLQLRTPMADALVQVLWSCRLWCHASPFTSIAGGGELGKKHARSGVIILEAGWQARR
jgi:hypothetical protein